MTGRSVPALVAGALVGVAAACGPKVETASSPGGSATAPRPSQRDRLPADAVLWEGEALAGVDTSRILEKTGTLTRLAEPTEGAMVRWWPFAIDYWAIMRTDLELLLAPHVGRTIRVTGHFTKTYDDGNWIHEVAPVKIVAVADPPEAGE